MTIGLLTHGWICYGRRTIIRRCVLPLNIYIKNCKSLALQILNVATLNLNLNQIADKNINLRLTENNINIKKSNSINIGVNKCSQDL